MSKFKYRFESIKKIKEALEKKVQKEISIIEMEIDSLDQARRQVLEEKLSSQNNLSQRTNIKASELQFLVEVQNLLDMKAMEIQEEIVKFEKKKEVKMVELTQKIKEHKIFETLEERHYEDYLLSQNQIEQKEIDEIATQLFAREAQN